MTAVIEKTQAPKVICVLGGDHAYPSRHTLVAILEVIAHCRKVHGHIVQVLSIWMEVLEYALVADPNLHTAINPIWKNMPVYATQSFAKGVKAVVKSCSMLQKVYKLAARLTLKSCLEVLEDDVCDPSQHSCTAVLDQPLQDGSLFFS